MRYVYMSSDLKTSDMELYHHGILGMKCGIRRYQNSDGSLTEAGFGNNDSNPEYKVKHYIYDPYNTLQHFDFPKLPKLELPKLELPKLELPKVNLPKVPTNNLGNTKKLGQGKSDKGGKKDREWKKHKWISRKRDPKTGKWIYEYGDDGSDKKKTAGIKKYKDANWKPKLADISPLHKLLNPIVGLGKVVVGPTMADKIQGGKEFIGALSEGVKQIKARALKFGTETDKDTGLQLKHQDNGKDFDLKNSNPGWDNPDGGSQRNCPNCSVAYDLRRRGYEVTAKQNAAGMRESDILSMYDNPKTTTVRPSDTPSYTNSGYKNPSTTTNLEKAMANEPDGSRGLMMMHWGGGGGHIVAYEIENNTPYIYDAQPGERHELSDYIDRASDVTYFRTDNIEPNYDRAKKVVE